MQHQRNRHEVRDDRGHIIAVIDLIEPETPIADAGMVEFSADLADGRSVRLRLFPPAAAAIIERARAA